MSEDFLDDEILQMHIQESKEHLETIESDLLQIEQDGADIDDDLVNKVFRAAHSIKGGSGFLGLDVIKELAHKTENVLDMIRKRQMVPTPEVVNTVLNAFDRLGELLDNVHASNDADISEQVVSLQGLTSSNLPNEEKITVVEEVEIVHPGGDVSFTTTKFDLRQTLQGGTSLYILTYDLIKDVHRQGKTPLDILKTLDDSGSILDIRVSLIPVGDLDSVEIAKSLPMYVLYSSIVEPDLIGNLLHLVDESIYPVPESWEDGATAEREEVGEEPAPPAVPREMEKPQTTAPAATVKLEEKKDPPAIATNPDPTPAALKATKPKVADSQSDTLRVQVSVLDQLMNRAGELVLARNQLLQALTSNDKQAIAVAGQRIDLVTSELQESIMLTRMQPVSIIFNKFPRVVRDMARDLGKEMELLLEGKDVELDKTIIEGLGDPLTHLVRNSADHGIELPADRAASGKPSGGSIVLRAFHESGQVIIEIIDDGKGLDAQRIARKAVEKNIITQDQLQSMSEKEKLNLIMLPGFSTAEKVTDVSGRGVGMDVVKTNLDKMGGQVELLSEVGKGTTVRIKLPLTLAIIPCLLVTAGSERFALPQVNVGELIRIQASEVREKIEKVGDADVLILRGELIPLLQLSNVLNLDSVFYDYTDGIFKPDKRAALTDKRTQAENETGDEAEFKVESAVEERRYRPGSDVNIVVLQAGSFRFALKVDEVHDSVEIVVKPLGRHLNKCEVYAGATIMGDGRVALILDVPGLALAADLSSMAESTQAKQLLAAKTQAKDGATRQTLLLFHNGPDEYCSVPLHQVLRVEQIETSDIEIKGGKKVIQYRGGSLPIFALEEVANVDMLEERDKLAVIIFVVQGHDVGLLAVPPLDVLEGDFILDESTLRQPGICGSSIIRGQTTLMVDIFEMMQTLNPGWFEHVEPFADGSASEKKKEGGQSGVRHILLVEDSHFFRAQVKRFIEEVGYAVVEAEDGVEAWNYLTENPTSIGLVVTDLEMPKMDGFELTRKIKSDDRFQHLTVMALTSLAGEEDRQKGAQAGIDVYQIKMDKEDLLKGIQKHYV